MIRKQVYIQAGQDRALKRRARDLNVSESELIRLGIDHATRTPVPFRPDLGAWDEAMRFMRQRARMKVPQTGRNWTREELYEERLARLSR